MNWLLLAISSGVILGFWDICKKAAMLRASVFNVLALYTGFCFAVLMVDYQNAFNIDGAILPLVLLKSVLIYFCWLLAFVAIKHLPISVAGPLRSLTPLFTIAWGIGLLGERLTLVQSLGVVLILAAFFIIGRSNDSGSVALLKNKYFYMMVASTFLSSLSGLIDKVALKQINAGQLQFWFMLMLFLLYMTTHLVTSYKEGGKVTFSMNRYIPMMSLLMLAADRIYFIAVGMPGSQLSVIMPIRYVSVIISVVVGGLIYREENLKTKFIGVTQLMVGISLVFAG